MLTILFDLVRRSLGTDFEAKATPTSARINGKQSTSPDTTNYKGLDLPIHRVYIPDIIWCTGEAFDTYNQGRGTPGYVPDSLR